MEWRSVCSWCSCSDADDGFQKGGDEDDGSCLGDGEDRVDEVFLGDDGDDDDETLEVGENRASRIEAAWLLCTILTTTLLVYLKKMRVKLTGTKLISNKLKQTENKNR